MDKNRWIITLKFFAAYLVAAWTFLQFVDWALNRYSISPYWVDLLLWIFIGIIPSLLIYFYHQKRINTLTLHRREKIIFPLNIILIMIVTYFGFGNSDLGATTKTIDYETESGEKKSALITKEEFREGFYVYPFKPIDVDSSKHWLQYGINYLLTEDLIQNKNISPKLSNNRNTQTKARETNYFYDFYVDGEFEIIDSTYSLTAFIRESKSAKVINQQTFSGKNVFDLIDDVSVFVTENLSSKELNTPKYLDLDVKEFTTNSLKAFEYFMRRDYTKAVKEDKTFALAYLVNGKRNLNFSQGKYEERQIADKAYTYRSKLPLQKQGEALILKNLAYDEFDNAEKLVKLQLEVDPSDDTYNRILYNIYGRTKNINAYTQRSYDAWANAKNGTTGQYFIEAGLIKGENDDILKQIELFSLTQPNDEYIEYLKLRPLLHKGDIKAAQDLQDKFKLLHPDLENITKVYDTAIAYLKNSRSTVEKLKQFEGLYRANHNEQTSTLWVENNTLLQYVSNQNIHAYLLAGDNKIVSGSILGSRTWLKEFYPNASSEFYMFKLFQNDRRDTFESIYWKIDSTIVKAERFLEAKQYDSAKVAYEKAIEANPKHYFLKDALAHVNYMLNTDTETLQNQLKGVAGTYGPRQFWIEDGKLFYKRKQTDNGQVFQKIELLPISKNRYMNLTKLHDNYSFELENGKPMVSMGYVFLIDEESWVKYNDDNNTFRRTE